MKLNWITTAFACINLLLIIILCVFSVYLAVLLIKALRKYLRSSDSKKQITDQKTLSENLKTHRIRCNMTQEFVAERLHVSRQAVSKWENGTSTPSTANLLALANLFDVPAEELLKNIG